MIIYEIGILRCSSTSPTTYKNDFNADKLNPTVEKKSNDDVKKQILEASLPFVHEFGWSTKALSKGAETLGLSSAAQGIFHSGGFALVDYFSNNCNQRLHEILDTSSISTPEESTFNAIQNRLEMLLPYIKIWSDALAMTIKPENVPLWLKNQAEIADIIVYKAMKDNSVNWSWYNKRILVITLYQATEIYMLQDSSQDFEKTWKFLKKLTECGFEIEKRVDLKAEKINIIGDVISVGGITLRNLLGLNK